MLSSLLTIAILYVLKAFSRAVRWRNGSPGAVECDLIVRSSLLVAVADIAYIAERGAYVRWY